MVNRVYLAIILVVIALIVFSFLQKSSLVAPKTSSHQQALNTDSEKYSWEIKTIATGLEVPWDLALAEGRLFITERPGRLKVLENNQLKTIATLPQVVSIGESGLTGITLHPKFRENNFLFLYYTYREAGQILNRVSRFTFNQNSLGDEKIILDKLPGGGIHNGGRLRFGPDGKLWVLTGDAAKPNLAQDITSLGGKVLRLNDDGTIPSDNPIKGSPVFSLGHRNPQGLAWHLVTQELLITEHGQTAHDEINLIKPNNNYGWPEVQKCFSEDPRFTNPILCSGEETYAPSGIAAFNDSFVFAGLKGNLLEMVEVGGGKVGGRETIIKDTYGRLRAVITDKEGNIYVSTSNRDGRGNPTSEDDRILKITPKLNN